MTKNKCNPIIKSHRPWVVRLTPEAVEFLVATTKYGASRLKAYQIGRASCRERV